ncbi:exonuclease SbcCD subunit D [Rummeliibacillus sp. NPDC094406]|uniref:metallophosphoesterase family protein n=1 Tax=Rummeliibacillus sp. NPDC094406 TaxID=3364511 RepID=UPI0037F1BF5D
MSSIRFFHTADLHLDSPFKGMSELPENGFEKLRNSTFEAFSTFIQKAIEVKPDFVLIVGDIYDGEERSLRAQKNFQNGMEQLSAHQIPVVISYGNHDHLKGKWTRFSLPENVFVLPKETTKLVLNIRETEVNIYGFSYPERHVPQSMIDTYPIATEQNAVHIGMLHGSLQGNTSHDVYAPFTIEELLSKNYDYWALGHIHKRQVLHTDPPIIYPGNIQSRHRKELGLKGFYDVTMANFAADCTFVPTSAIVYEKVEVDCENLIHANEVLRACRESLGDFREHYGAGVVWLQLKNIDEKGMSLFENSSALEWLEVIREQEEEITPFVWVQALEIDNNTINMYEPTLATESVIQVLNEWNQQQLKEVVKDLYQHPKGSRYLEELTSEELNNLVSEAKRLFKQYMSVKKG